MSVTDVWFALTTISVLTNAIVEPSGAHHGSNAYMPGGVTRCSPLPSAPIVKIAALVQVLPASGDMFCRAKTRLRPSGDQRGVSFMPWQFRVAQHCSEPFVVLVAGSSVTVPLATSRTARLVIPSRFP